MKNLCLLTIAMAISTKSNAQQMELITLKRIDPSTIITSNYIKIPDCSDSKNKLFDIDNPYSYLQLMVDESGNSYQILYQTDFADGLAYLSISNNANYDCFKIKKNEYCSCVSKSHEETFPSLQTSATLDCVIKMVRRCAE